MANMVQCDKCGHVDDFMKTYFVETYKRYGETKGNFKEGFDLCEKCHKELIEQCSQKKEADRDR